MMSSVQKEKILNALLDLHLWRENYNGEDIGFGADELFGNESERRHFPHAYAIWGSGYINLYKSTEEKKYLNKAQRCAQWLTYNPNSKCQNYSWGLPLALGKTNPNASFCITTLYCANLFYELYTITQEKKYVEILSSIRKWLIEECEFEYDLKKTKGIWFRYANSSEFAVSIYNVTAMAAGFFAKLYLASIGEKDEDAYFAASCARYILGKQNALGFWYYGDAAVQIDVIHTALVLEGLADFYKYAGFFEWKLKEKIGIGCKFLGKKIVNSRGYALESYPIVIIAPWEIRGYRTTISVLLKGIFRHSSLETRSYGYGMAIKALRKCDDIIKPLSVDYDILVNYLLENYQKRNGAFKFRKDIPHEYIRAEGHIFDGLSFLLASEA